MLTMINIASAWVPGGASDAVAGGIEQFCINTGDKIFEMSFLGYDDTVKENTVGVIYNIASYTLDPMKLQTTHDLIDFSKDIFKRFYPILLIFAFITTLIIHYKTGAVKELEKLTGINLGKSSNELTRKSIDGIKIIVFMYVFIYLVLLLNNILTKLVLTNIIDSVAPSPDNFILYLFMALSYLILGFFFTMRTLVIYLYCGFAYLIGLASLVDCLYDTSAKITAYFTQTVFFQFIVVLYFSACILIIKALVHPTDDGGKQIMYTVMLLGGIYISIEMMYGTKVIQWAGKKAALLV